MSGVRAVEFLGRSFPIPGGYSAWRAKPTPAGLSPDNNTQIIIGAADNGWFANDDDLIEDKRIMEFGSFDEAKAILKSGDLLDAIKAAFRPSEDPRYATGPQIVRALNVCENVAASGTLTNANSQTYPVEAVIPGPDGNDVRLRVSSSGDKVEIGDSKGIESQTGMKAIDAILAFSGTADSAVASWNGTTFLVTLTNPTGCATLSITVPTGMTMRQLADKINIKSGYAMTLNVPDEWPVARLDYYSAVDVKAAPANIRSALYRQEKFIKDSGFALVDTESGGRYALSDMTTYVYLAGGSTGTPDSTDYLDAISYQQEMTTGLYINVCSSAEAIVAALTDAVLGGNSAEGKNERFGGAGGDQEDSYAERCAAGKAVNSEYMVYGASPVTLYRADGITKKTFDGWMLAVLHNAIKASTNVNQSAINKDLNILDAPEKLTKTQIKLGISSGVLIVDRKPNKGAFKIIYDLTTTNKSNIVLNKAQTVCIGLALAKDLRESLEAAFFGETPTDPDYRATVLADSDIRTFIEQKFDYDYVQNFGWLTRNIYTGSAAWKRDFKIQRDGNVMYFIFDDATLVSSIDFMFSLLNYSLVQGSSTGA